MQLPPEVSEIVFDYARLERFKELIALRAGSSTFYAIVRDYKPARLSVCRECVKLGVNQELLYDNSDDFFSGESGNLVSLQDIMSGNFCTEWKGWLNFVKEIVVPEQKTEKQTPNLLKAFLACLGQSELALPKDIEFEIKQPCSPASKGIYQLLKRIDCFTIPFVATVI